MESKEIEVIGEGDIVWEWEVKRERVVKKKDIENYMGNKERKMKGKVRKWMKEMNEEERESLR